MISEESRNVLEEIKSEGAFLYWGACVLIVIGFVLLCVQGCFLSRTADDIARAVHRQELSTVAVVESVKDVAHALDKVAQATLVAGSEK